MNIGNLLILSSHYFSLSPVNYSADGFPVCKQFIVFSDFIALPFRVFPGSRGYCRWLY